MTETVAPPALAAAPPAISPSHTWRTELRALMALGWPLIVAQVAQNALLITDVIMMGWLGPKFLAAGALANALFGCLQLFGVGVVGAVAPMAAQALGARDFRSVRRTVRQGMWLAVIMAVLLFPLIWNIGPIYKALGQDPELSDMAGQFTHAAIWLMFPSLLCVALRSFMAATGATRPILVITLICVVVNGLADYALMFGHFGLPRLELMGSGIATTSVYVVMLALMVGYILSRRRLRRYHVFHRLLRPDWQKLWELVRLGAPIGIMLLAEVGLFACAALLQGWLGQNEVAAHAIAQQLASLSFMVPLGLSQATTVRVGIAYGERNTAGIGRAGWVSLVATLLFMACVSLCFVLFPSHLVALFLDPANPTNTRVLELATSYLVIAGLFQLVDGTQASMGAALRGLSDTRVPLIFALIGYWVVGAPVAWLFGFPLGLRGIGVWLGLAAGLATTAVILSARFAMRRRLGLMRPDYELQPSS